VPLDPDAERLLANYTSYFGQLKSGQRTIAQIRDAMVASAAQAFGPTDPVHSVENRDADGVPVRIYRGTAGGDPLPLLVHFHGGGWVFNNVDTHDGVCRAIASRTPCIVVAPSYRQAPEHPFPAAIDDAWQATLWAVRNAAALGADPMRLAVGGDSAGGNLAAVVARRARDAGMRLALQILLYPVTDHDFDRPSYHRNADGYGLTRETMMWYWDQYLGDRDRNHPDASPLHAADLGNLAPALIMNVEYDPICDDGAAYAEKLRQAGVAVDYVCEPGLIHGSYRMIAKIPAGRRLILRAVSALQRAFYGRETAPAAALPT
jgi:acetyl esterase